MTELEFAQEAEKRGMATYYMSADSRFNHVGATLWLEVPLKDVPLKKSDRPWLKAVPRKWFKDKHGRRWYHFYGGAVRV